MLPFLFVSLHNQSLFNFSIRIIWLMLLEYILNKINLCPHTMLVYGTYVLTLIFEVIAVRRVWAAASSALASSSARLLGSTSQYTS